MKALTLSNPSGEVKAPYCGKCGHIWLDLESAEGCCTCNDCKTELKQNENYQCSPCMEINSMKRRIEMLGKCEDITDSNYDGPVFIEGSHDRYFSDIGDAIEHYLDDDEDVWPEWCHPVEVKKFDMDVFEYIGNYLESEHHDEFEINKMDELQEFWEKWSAKQTEVTWWPDETKKINLRLLLEKEKAI
jgi:hypothetical protein